MWSWLSPVVWFGPFRGRYLSDFAVNEGPDFFVFFDFDLGLAFEEIADFAGGGFVDRFKAEGEATIAAHCHFNFAAGYFVDLFHSATPVWLVDVVIVVHNQNYARGF
jgi:hypothetical protein